MGGPTGVKRVKSGCVTCRIRRVKCDEAKPECRRCLSTGRKCDGYSTLPFSRRDLQAASQSASRQRDPHGTSHDTEGLLPCLVTDPAFANLLEKRYFQFFRQRTVGSTNSIVDARFWDRVVLQACHAEPAIKHAVLALSSLHQLNGLARDSDTACQHRLYAEKQHHLAVAEAQNLIASASDQDADRVLIACIIFTIVAGVRGDYRAAAMHMDSGRAIVAQNAERLKHAARRKDLVEIEHALARLDLPAICFSDRTSPYRYTLVDFYHTDPLLTPHHFQDAQEAQRSIVDLLRWLLLICTHIDHEHRNGDLVSMARYEAEKFRCATAFAKWDEHFAEVLLATDDASTSATLLNLQIWRALAATALEVETYAPETRYDDVMHYFEQMVTYGEKLATSLAEPTGSRSFSFDLGYNIPLYFTATRCRDPQLRRRAIGLMKAYPRQEGVWESVAAGTVAIRWMEVEEEGLGVVTCAADIPEHRRIRYIDTEVSVERRCASVKLRRADGREAREVVANWKGAREGDDGDGDGDGGNGTGTRAEAFALESHHYLEMWEEYSALPTLEVRRASLPTPSPSPHQHAASSSSSSGTPDEMKEMKEIYRHDSCREMEISS